MASAIGALTNPNKLQKTFKSVNNSKITATTITKYIEYLEDDFLNVIYNELRMRGFHVDVGNLTVVEKSKDAKPVTFISVGLSIIAVLFLTMAREPYAITVTFLLLLIKGILLYKQAKAGL